MKRSHSRIKKYTAFVPKTLKATTNVGRSTIKAVRYFLRNTLKNVKNTTKMLNKKTAKSIRSFTQKKLRK